MQSRAGPSSRRTSRRQQAEPTQARFTLVQTGFPDAVTRDNFATAWPDVLAMIANRVE